MAPRKVILNSISGYSSEHVALLNKLIDEGVLLFCAVGKDCELWHDIMDEVFVGDGTIERHTDIITTWHEGETLDDVIAFAEMYDLGEYKSGALRVITI